MSVATLNIKDSSVYEMASVLAKHWMTTRTGAIRRVLSETLSDLGLDDHSRRVQCEAILRDLAPYVKREVTSAMVDADLYDEAGLPR